MATRGRRLSQGAMSQETAGLTVVPAEGVDPQDVTVVTAVAINPNEATPPGPNEAPIVVVAAEPIGGGWGLQRTASAVLMARPVVVTRNRVPMLGCHCPSAADLPSCCDEDAAMKLCAFLAYCVVGAMIIFASYAATFIAGALGVYDPDAWKTFFVTWLLCILVGICFAGVAAALCEGEDEVGTCCMGFTALGLLSALLCYGVSPPLAANWYMFEGSPPVRMVDPELAAGERTVYTGNDVDIISSAFVGRLTEYGSTSSSAVFDAPIDDAAGKYINQQGEYQEVEFALSSVSSHPRRCTPISCVCGFVFQTLALCCRPQFVDTTLSLPIYFDSDDVALVDDDLETVTIPQLCVAPVLRTCNVLPGGAPWSDMFTGSPPVLMQNGIAPLNASNLPTPNPSVNQAYCDARRRDAQKPCDLFKDGLGLECSAGASTPVDLYVNFFLYIKVEQLEITEGARETCARTWQRAFEYSSFEGGPNPHASDYMYSAQPSGNDVWYPQPENMGEPVRHERSATICLLGTVCLL